ncbi:MAG: VanZ family protein [Trueperaceae bacterium]
MPERRHRAAAWLGAAAWAALLFGLSSLPAGATPTSPISFPGDDKVVHAALYAVLGGLLRVAVGRTGPAIALAAAYGATDEAHQAFVPGRDADAFDWFADVAGAALGAALAARAWRTWRASRGGDGPPR